MTDYITNTCIMGFYVRPIERKDKEQWVDLWCGKDSYLVFYNGLDRVPAHVTETTFNRFFDDKEPVYSAVAVDDESEQVIGFANYLTHRNTWTIEDALYLNDLFVSPNNRLKGVGRALIEFTYKEADRMNCKKCYWSTQFENHRAQLLYTKVGQKSGFLLYRRPD